MPYIFDIYSRESHTPFTLHHAFTPASLYTPPFWGLTQTKVGYLLSFTYFICCMKLSEHITRISCTFYFHLPAEQQFLSCLTIVEWLSTVSEGNITQLDHKQNRHWVENKSHPYFAHFEYAELISLFSLPKNALPPLFCALWIRELISLFSMPKNALPSLYFTQSACAELIYL